MEKVIEIGSHLVVLIISLTVTLMLHMYLLRKWCEENKCIDRYIYHRMIMFSFIPSYDLSLIKDYFKDKPDQYFYPIILGLTSLFVLEYLAGHLIEYAKQFI